jgi:Ca2+-binding RTX toxin-like protein
MQERFEPEHARDRTERHDTLVWNPGDGSDVVEGQAGSDTLQVNGSNASETIDISANGERVRFFRDVAAVTLGYRRHGARRLSCHRQRGNDH